MLPLQNLSADAEQEYFADRMTDILISELARLNIWQVISRTSMMCYKGIRKGIRKSIQRVESDAEDKRAEDLGGVPVSRPDSVPQQCGRLDLDQVPSPRKVPRRSISSRPVTIQTVTARCSAISCERMASLSRLAMTPTA